MIKIKSPRYHDRKLLIARYRIPAGADIKVEILTGSYKGIYRVTSSVICHSPIEQLRTRNGNCISMRAVSLDELEPLNVENSTNNL